MAKNDPTTKVFKSGNSKAVRLPASFDIEPGTTVRVREERGRYIIEPVERERKKINIERILGSAPGLELLKPEDRQFEERELAWPWKRPEDE
ncbi:AbrB/MazE/SpoVT family DNA-binding domain-containing protein [Novosphingopyxis sp.]|uniref:AbrB/MazE/SpoVT family DNA-binding domain-containing protein n=1 Tax=Novosphingopyxis sp. TaxID=2709690 RepID=UPI003B5A10AE